MLLRTGRLSLRWTVIMQPMFFILFQPSSCFLKILKDWYLGGSSEEICVYVFTGSLAKI